MGDKCEKCRVKVQRELTSMKVKMVNGKYLIINNVPNTVCSFCGDRYMSEGTLKMIQYVIDKYTVNINDDDYSLKDHDDVKTYEVDLLEQSGL